VGDDAGPRDLPHELSGGDLGDERREEVVFLSTTVPVVENLDRIGGSPHTRFPLVGADPADPDAFRGIVYVPSVVERVDALREGAAAFEDLAAPPMTLGPEAHISDAVDRFQDANQELALVVDDGRVVGLVTATDALEAVVGEIEDPLDIALDDRSSSA
jgi:CBS domain containing-hemolysin-like protein